MLGTEIDFAKSTDLEQIESLFLEIIESIPYYNDLAKENEIKRYTKAELEFKLVEDPFSIISAKQDGIVIGFCFSRFDDFTIWLEWFGISPNHQRQGIAKLLLEKLEFSAEARKCHKIWCDTRTENKRSSDVLEKNGFSKIVEIKNHWYGQDFFLWQKFIGK
ncbi:GNAT family N-acetyltransferase [uncultured Algoriphagus sp.]|uniref:GNAT family N-acetyltransferase n=1 Tax=uncultured Algoriphagus sp. TaxID=417365 RepID=UPI0030EEF72F|tara:strand:- start:2314 stop:2799 length:486 start_codon:yes stop_codon:yes gene_type:complete